jgi:RNase H-fold protein (predicted Holliday junction resolvase)
MIENYFVIKKLKYNEINQYKKKFNFSAFENYENFDNSYDIQYFAFFSRKPVPECIWPLCIVKNASNKPHNFYYFGPIFENSIINNKRLNLKKIFSIIKCYLKFFSFFLKKIEFSTKYLFINQIISFLNTSNIFREQSIQLKATAVVNKNKEYEWRKLRLRQLQKFKKNYLEKTNITSKLTDERKAMDLAIKFYNSKNINHTKHINSLKNFLNHSSSNIIKLYFQDKKNSLVGLLILLKDKEFFHLAYNIADINWKKKGLMPFMINELFKIAKKENLNIDFNGANSLIGSDDKISYGSNLEYYLDVEIVYSL